MLRGGKLGKYSISNKDLVVFLVITFGLTIFMGLAMAIAYPTYPVDSFPLVQMYYPAFGAMVALLLNKELRNKLPKNFFKAYIFLVSISVLFLLSMLFIFDQDPSFGITNGLLISSIALAAAYNTDLKENIQMFGLKFTKNFKKSIPYIILFIILYLLRTLLVLLIVGEGNSFIMPFKNMRTWRGLFLLPLSFLLSYPAFLGEEYGWRYFLQTALQERLGKRKGVLVLGLLWGIWHLPLNLFYYSPETSFYSVINQLIVCVCYSVFFGYVYMKTENIWAISMIHFINNSLVSVLFGATGTDMVVTWQDIVLNVISSTIIYIPFLFTKAYKESSKTKINSENNKS